MRTQPVARGLQPDDIYALHVAEDPRISPDGRHVVFVVMRMERDGHRYIRSLWLAQADGGGAVQLSDGNDDGSPRWSPDGSAIAFIRTPPPNTRPDSEAAAASGAGRPQLWVCDGDGSNMRQATHLRGGAADPVWSPDSRSLIVTSQAGEADDADAERASWSGSAVPAVRRVSRLWYRADGIGYTYERRSHLVHVSLDSAATRQLTDGDFDSRQPSFSPDGRTLAFVSDHSGDRFRWPGGAIWLLDAGSDSPRRITPEAIACGRPVWSPDGSHIAYRGTEVLTSDGYVELYAVAVAGGDPRMLSDGFLPTCANVCLDDQRVPPGHDEPMWSADGSEVWLLASAFGSVHLWAVRLDGQGWRQLTTGQRQLYAVSADRATQRVALGCSTPLIPGDVFVHHLSSGEEVRITDLNHALFAQRSLADASEYSVRASDGEIVHGWVMRPAGAHPSDQLPAVLEVHGGPMAMYGWTFCLEFQLLAAQGLAVVYGNPRGSVGYGRDFARSIALHWGERDHQDLLELMDGAIAGGGIDTARTAVVGGSYGGYMVLWMLGHDEQRRWRSGIAMRPLSNWATFFGTSDIGPRFTLLEAGGVPWHDLDRLMAHSPLAFVDRIQAPLLLMHSERDLRCPIAESEQVFAALAFLNRPVEFVRFEEQSHDLSRSGHPRSREIRLRCITGWLAQHLHGAPAAPPPAAERGPI